MFIAFWVARKKGVFGRTEVKSAEEVLNSSSFLQRPAVHKLQMLARRMHVEPEMWSCLRRFVQQLISSFVSLKLISFNSSSSLLLKRHVDRLSDHVAKQLTAFLQGPATGAACDLSF